MVYIVIVTHKINCTPSITIPIGQANQQRSLKATNKEFSLNKTDDWKTRSECSP